MAAVTSDKDVNVLIEPMGLDEPLTCDWDRVTVGGPCSEVATHRAGYVCCSTWSLLCKRHARWWQNYVNLHAKDTITCDEHGFQGFVRDVMKVLPL